MINFKKAVLAVFSGLVVAAVAFSFLGAVSVFGAGDSAERKIVVFESDVFSEADQDILVGKHGGVKIKNLKLVNGQAVLLSKKAEKELAKENDVLRIEDDFQVFALAQVLPWGIDRIDAEPVLLGSIAGAGIKVGVIDTGISTSHPDIVANLNGGVNTINARKGFNDDNGHGSHVAGIIAAVNNSVGVVGVANRASLYAIKVLNSAGSGYLSDVIEGLDWAIANGMNVVNMSLGCDCDSLTFHEAIIKVNAAGIVQVAAAGNSGAGVIYPAAYPEAIAVSATDKADNIASFSSRGSEVDLAAPGVSIYSTYRGSKYATLSGTSMSAPHVAGAAALVLTRPIGAYDFDADGIWDPNEVQKKLQDTAVDFGAVGFDNLYGWGLVNAFAAIQ